MKTLSAILLFLCLCLSVQGNATAAPLVLSASDGRVPVADQMEMLHDKTGSLSLDDIRSARSSSLFKPVPGYLSTGTVPGATWLRFTVSVKAEYQQPILLELNPAFNEEVWLFTPDSDGSYQSKLAGSLAPFSKEKAAYRNPVFKLQLQPDKPHTLYLRISSKRVIMAKLFLWQPDFFRQAIVREALFHGAYIGCIMIILFINLLYWVRLRKALYGYYSFYVFALLVMFAENHGYLFQYLLTENPWLSLAIFRLDLALLIAMGAGFFSEILELGRRLPRTDRLYRYSCYTIALTGAILAFTPLRYQIGKLLYLGIFASALFNLVIAIYFSLKKTPLARLYLLAFTPALLVFMYAVMVVLGAAPRYDSFENILLVSTMLHMVLLNIAVADRVSRISAEKQTVEMALAAEHQIVEQQSQFVRLISHELRTPLAIIDSAAQILPLMQNDPPLLIRKAEAIRGATRRLANLLDSCLNVERLAMEGLKPELVPTALPDVIRSAADHIRLVSDRYTITVDSENLPDTFLCDPMLIEVLLTNLLDNAVKYSPDGGEITLRGWSDQQGNLTLEVWDPGIGIQPEQYDLIFNRFHRAGQLPGVSGAGLGLYLCRQIAEMHGGTISCNSEPGHGSIFSVKLPAATS